MTPLAYWLVVTLLFLVIPVTVISTLEVKDRLQGKRRDARPIDTDTVYLEMDMTPGEWDRFAEEVEAGLDRDRLDKPQRVRWEVVKR